MIKDETTGQGLSDALADALRLHQAGNLAGAESLYVRILAADPECADALHLLGLIAYQRGDNMQAVEYIEKAVAINPSVSIYHNNLGSAFMNLEETDKAARCFRTAIHLNPDYVEAYNNMGNVLRRQGENKKALQQYMKAIELKPDYVPAVNNLANLLKGEGRLDEAIVHYRRAIGLQPDIAETHFNLGNALKETGDLQEAEEYYRNAISINPDFAEAHNNLANILKKQRKYDEASAHYHKAVSINPDFADAYANLGDTCREQGAFKEAVRHCRKAIGLNPDSEQAYINLGNTFLDKGDLQKAEEQYNKAIALKPDSADAHYNRGLVLLMKGEFEEGWKEYKWRFKSAEISGDIGYRGTEIPEWDGSPLNGRTVLISSEQGAGDHIQFVRYIPLVKAAGGRVIYECSRSLIRLFENFKGIDVLSESPYDHGRGGKPDVCISLLNLPAVFGTTIDRIPADIPYLSVDRYAAEQWKHRINSRAFKVGLVWAGNPEHRNDRNRSCRLRDFEPLAALPGIEFFSLQKGVTGDSPPASLHLVDITKYLGDFHDTAAVIENLDLVISVDTAVAHLAGALGRPVWTLLPFVPDWRWMLKREDTPWYPTMRLFRQERHGEWAPVMKKVAGELEKICKLKGAQDE
ncbi:MAG: tetratricopeptide repeat protein [Deferribacteres bacterium]|nr:tetratricopeptide repeat protein [Deferribacteres bacterium]